MGKDWGTQWNFFCLGLYWWDFRNPRLLKPVRKFGARKTPLLVKEDQVRKYLNKLDTHKALCAEGVVQCCCEATLGLWKVMAIGWDSWGLKNTDVTYVCMNERRRIQGSAGQLASPLSLKADGANNSGNHFQTGKEHIKEVIGVVRFMKWKWCLAKLIVFYDVTIPWVRGEQWILFILTSVRLSMLSLMTSSQTTKAQSRYMHSEVD